MLEVLLNQAGPMIGKAFLAIPQYNLARMALCFPSFSVPHFWLGVKTVRRMLSTELGTMNHVGRRQFMLDAAALLVAPLVAQAQRATKPYRIGVLQTEESQRALLQQ